MAVELTATDASFTGTGISSTYAAPIYANDDDQIRVSVDGVLKTLGDDYVLNGLGSAAGISIIATFTLNSKVYIERVTPVKQDVDTQNNETILEDVLDGALDKLTMMMQERVGETRRALLAPKGESNLLLSSALVRAGFVLEFDPATGAPVTTLSADKLRSLIAAAFTPSLQQLADNVLFLANYATASARSVRSKMQETLSVRDFGAIGDGFVHYLNEKFATLVAAQAVYPFVTNIATQTLDYAGFQAALNAVEGQIANRGTVFVPEGSYIFSNTVQIPNNVALRGQGPNSIINNQSFVLAVPLFTNKNAVGFVNVQVSDLVCLGGTIAFAINVSGETSTLLFERVSMSLQSSANFTCNKLLQVASFIDCGFDSSPQGVYVAAPTTNLVNFIRCGFTNHSAQCVFIDTLEQVSFVGCRFEAGGNNVNTVPTISFNAPKSVNFRGCYFEATHVTLINEAGSTDTTKFDDCHFTGGVPDLVTLQGYKFVSDGVIEFGTNHWTFPSVGPAKMRITGQNKLGLLSGSSELHFAGSQHYTPALVARPRAYSATTVDLITISRINSVAVNSNAQQMIVKLQFNYAGFVAGGFDRWCYRELRIRIRALSNNALTADIQTEVTDDALSGATIVFSAVAASATSITIRATTTGISVGEVSSKMTWAARQLLASNADDDMLKMVLAS